MVRHGARLFSALFFALLTVLITPNSFADTLLISGTIYTADDANPMVEAVVIKDAVSYTHLRAHET